MKRVRARKASATRKNKVIQKKQKKKKKKNKLKTCLTSIVSKNLNREDIPPDRVGDDDGPDQRSIKKNKKKKKKKKMSA